MPTWTSSSLSTLSLGCEMIGYFVFALTVSIFFKLCFLIIHMSTFIVGRKRTSFFFKWNLAPNSDTPSPFLLWLHILYSSTSVPPHMLFPQCEMPLPSSFFQNMLSFWPRSNITLPSLFRGAFSQPSTKLQHNSPEASLNIWSLSLSSFIAYLYAYMYVHEIFTCIIVSPNRWHHPGWWVPLDISSPLLSCLT